MSVHTHKGQVPRRKDRSALDVAELNALCNRLEDLGATRAQTDAIRGAWHTATPDQRVALIAVDDMSIEAEIARANEADEFHEVDVEPADPAHVELMGEAAALVETWGPRQLLNDWVKGDAVRARALLDVERGGRNRASLVRVLEELAGA